LATEINLILHVAWTVNFRLKLQSFATENLTGLSNLIDFALASPHTRQPLFTSCPTTAAITNAQFSPNGSITKCLPDDPRSASPFGYPRSKQVAEQICNKDHHQTSLRGNISIIRVGQLSGDSSNGIWNSKEAWPIMLSTAKLVGALPKLGTEVLDWLPVDIAAKAFLEGSHIMAVSKGQIPVYHVLNPCQQPMWGDMLSYMRGKEPFEIVDPAEWVRRLEDSENMSHPAKKLLPLWKNLYGHGAPPENKSRPHFSIASTKERLPSMRDVEPLDPSYLEKVWNWVQDTIQLEYHLNSCETQAEKFLTNSWPTFHRIYNTERSHLQSGRRETE